jgi:Spy/CpxP family protein refolding chaperone
VQDQLVERVGLTPRQANKVVAVHEKYAAALEKVDAKYQREADKIRTTETKQIARIVGEDKVARVERVLKPPWWRQLPWQRSGGTGGRGSPGSSGSGSDWREWVRNPKDLSPQQKLKLRDLMKSYQEQLSDLQDKLRTKLNEILSSEQVQRFRSGSDGAEEK